MINNIAVFAQMYVTYNYCTAAYTLFIAVVLYVEKTWVQKNEYWIFCDIYIFMFAIIMNATPDADKATAFAKDDVEDDDRKDWASIFWKKWKHQLPNSSPRPDIVASYI